MEKRPGNLDDVAKLLSKKAEQKIILKKRNQSQRILRHKRNKREHNEERRILVIPVLIVVLILLIKLLEALGFGGGVSNGKNSPASASNLSSSSDLVDVQEEHALKVYNDDVLQKFFQDYFQAKLAADVDTLYRLSGVTNQSTEQRAKLKSQLKTQAGYIESYVDIKTYAVPGIGNEANSFELVENRTPEQTKFIYAYIQKHQEVKDLINAVDSQLLEALSSDSRLAVLYDAFQTGRIYKEDQASIDSQVSLIEMDENGPTEAKSASETEAESTGTEGKLESSASESSTSAG